MKILINPGSDYRDKADAFSLLRMNNFADEIKLIAYSLMPNHFHLQVKQESSNAIDLFMNSLGTRYTMYFNKKDKRVGPLYQSVYKAVLVESDEQLLYLTSYIHRNPLGDKFVPKAKLLSKLFSQPSSLPEYLGERQTDWIHPEFILPFFSKTNPKLSYQSFVEQVENLSFIQNLVLDI